MITPLGDIFKPSSNVSTGSISGQGVLITNSNELTEANFAYSIIQSGRMSKLYSNGEYYDGTVIFKGIRNGTGVYYYSNGDIYT